MLEYQRDRPARGGRPAAGGDEQRGRQERDGDQPARRAAAGGEKNGPTRSAIVAGAHGSSGRGGPRDGGGGESSGLDGGRQGRGGAATRTRARGNPRALVTADTAYDDFMLLSWIEVATFLPFFSSNETDTMAPFLSASLGGFTDLGIVSWVPSSSVSLVWSMFTLLTRPSTECPVSIMGFFSIVGLSDFGVWAGSLY